MLQAQKQSQSLSKLKPLNQVLSDEEDVLPNKNQTCKNKKIIQTSRSK